jgi:signal transduction histidine kinase
MVSAPPAARRRTLRSYLISWTVLTVIPLVILTGWLVSRLDREYRLGSRDHVLRTARALSEAVDADLRVTVASLENLATWSILDTDDRRAVHDRMLSMAQTRGWTTVTLLDASGQVLTTAAEDAGATAASSEYAGIHGDVLRTAKPAVSGLLVGHGHPQPVIAVAVPGIRDRVVRYVLVAGVPAVNLGKVLKGQPIPADWRMGINDRNQVIVTSTLQPDPFVGQRITSRMATESARATEGWFENINKEGRAIFAAFHRSPFSGLVTVINVPRVAVDGAANRSLIILGGAGLLILAGSLAAALIFGHRFATSVRGVRDTANALAEGQAALKGPVLDTQEFRDAYGALDAAATVLAARAAERDRLLGDEQRARADAERTNKVLHQLQLMTEIPLRETSTASVMRELLAGVREVLTADTATILLVSEDGSYLSPVSSDGLREIVTEDVRVPIGAGLAGGIAVTRAGIIVPDVASSEVFSTFLRDRIKSLVGAPMQVGGRLIGVIHVGTSAPREFTEDDLQLLGLLADRVALGIEHARLREAESAARRDAEAANRTKDDFLAMLSHELRNPLNAITGWTPLLRKRTADQDTLRGVQAVERNALVLTRLVDDLLDVSRIVSGQLSIDRGPVEMTSLVAGVLDTMDAVAAEKGIILHRVLRLSPCIVRGDANRLHQVVANLVGNAIKFTPAGGSVEVRVQRDVSEVTMAVTDTGAGIAAEFLPRVFDRFSQEDTSTTREHGGLGLGLAIVDSIVKAHGGTITAESPGHGRGARFTVRLPARKSD